MADRDLVSSQAGLAAAVAVESGPELGEGTEPVRARSYWEQVWTRFRRDKAAMISGVFIICLVLVAACGGPRGWIDPVISPIIVVPLAFPALLFIIALAATIGERLNNVTFGVFGKGV